MPPGRRAHLAIVVLGAVATASAGAKAGQVRERLVAVAPFEVDGDLGPKIVGRFNDALRAGLGRGDVRVLPAACLAPVPGDAWSDKCRGPGKTHPDFFVRPEVHVLRDRDYVVRLELFDGRTQKRLATSRAVCDVCPIEDAATLVSGHAAALWAKVDATDLKAPTVRIKSIPTGALVEIDGRTLGTSPLVSEVDAGEHVVAVVKPGYQPRRVKFVAAPGFEENLSLTLTRASPKADRLAALKGWGIGALVTGAASLAAGAALLGLHRRPWQRRCSGRDVDPLGECRFRYETLAGGVTMTVAAALLLATSAALLGTYARRRRQNGKRTRF